MKAVQCCRWLRFDFINGVEAEFHQPQFRFWGTRRNHRSLGQAIAEGAGWLPFWYLSITMWSWGRCRWTSDWVSRAGKQTSDQPYVCLGFPWISPVRFHNWYHSWRWFVQGRSSWILTVMKFCTFLAFFFANDRSTCPSSWKNIRSALTRMSLRNLCYT